MVQKIGCAEIWGGIRGDMLDCQSSGVRASLFSRACQGGKGGDIYYFSVCNGDLLTRIAIADVTGHGEKVSHVSQWMFDALSKHMNDGEGNKVLHDLNVAAMDYGYQAIATATIAAFYSEDSNLYFSYAGHHEILVHRKSENDWESLEGREGKEKYGLPLGVLGETDYVQSNVPVKSGDRIFFYTDGVIEALDSNEEVFGIERLKAVLDSTNTLGLESIRARVLDSLIDHTGNQMDHDDVTFMAVEIL